MPSNFEQLIFEIIATDRNASAAFDKFRGQVDRTSRSVDKNTAELDRNAESLDNTGTKAANAAGGFSNLAGVGGMGALIAAGAALAPVLVTVGVGLTGFGAAAAGSILPIVNAAKATGGLRANLAKLDPEQQQLALSVLALQKQYDAFQRSLRPEVFGVFGAGLRLAGHLMRDVQPVAKTTGAAIGGLLDRIDTEFQSGTWRNFFGWMAAHAGPDIKLLGDSFITLMRTLPPLLQEMQPLSVDLLAITNAALKLVQVGAELQHSNDRTGHSMGALQQIATALKLALFAPGVGLYHALKLLGIVSPDASRGLAKTGIAAGGAVTQVQSLAQAVNDLNTAQSKALDTQLAYSNSLITAANDAKTLRQALQASRGQVGLHTAAQRASFGAANTYIADLENEAKQATASGRGARGAAAAIQSGLPILEQAARHNHLLWQEVQTLKGWLDKLRLEPAIREKINVLGLGQWSVSAATHKIAQGPGPFAAGGLVTGGVAGRDSRLILAMPGEVVVPTGMVNAGAVDHLRGQLPGFATGGIVGSYKGNLAGLQPWAAANSAATQRIVLSDLIHGVVAAAGAAMAAAAAAAARRGIGAGVGGPGGGAPAANAALARAMMPAWGSGPEWAAWNYVAMRESGWNQFARNPTSGAYGIPQALPPGKMGAAANPPQSNPRAQISWMIGYIHSVYGDPINAAAHERNLNWYDDGGMLPVGASVAVNTTGRPELVTSQGGLAVLAAKLDRLIYAVERSGPASTAAGVAGAVNGASRQAARSALYSARPR